MKFLQSKISLDKRLKNWHTALRNNKEAHKMTSHWTIEDLMWYLRYFGSLSSSDIC